MKKSKYMSKMKKGGSMKKTKYYMSKGGAVKKSKYMSKGGAVGKAPHNRLY